MLKKIMLWSALILAFLGCSDTKEMTKIKGIKEVYTVNYPLYYFTKRMAPEGIKVLLPMPKDIDPAFWKPTTEDVMGFINADLIILNGADYAKWVKNFSLPESKSVNTSKSFEKELIHIQAKSKHTHGPEGEHSHAGTAFTTWLDMQQAISQAKIIKEALIDLEPSQKASIESKYITLKKELQALDEAFKGASLSSQKNIIASHPIYQYFARAYGLNIHPLLWEPEMKLDEKAKSDIQKLLKEHPSSLMIWEGEPSRENRDYVTDLGLKGIVIKPLMNQPEEGDFISGMKENIKNMNAD